MFENRLSGVRHLCHGPVQAQTAAVPTKMIVFRDSPFMFFIILVIQSVLLSFSASRFHGATAVSPYCSTIHRSLQRRRWKTLICTKERVTLFCAVFLLRKKAACILQTIHFQLKTRGTVYMVPPVFINGPFPLSSFSQENTAVSSLSNHSGLTMEVGHWEWPHRYTALALMASPQFQTRRFPSRVTLPLAV